MTRTHRNLIAWAKACAALLLLASPLAAEHLIVRGSYVIDGQLRQIGRVSGELTMLDVTITPPLWHRASFLAALAVQLAAALVYAHKLRVRRLLELERIRTRIAADLHDDLGASLARVSLLSEATRRVLRERPDRAERMLDEIGTTSRELVTTAGDIAFAIDPEHGRLDDLAARLRRFAEDLLAGSSIALCFSVDGEPADVVLSSDQRRHLLAIVKEALHNAVRHGQPERVSLTLTRRDGAIEIEVGDDGCGFRTEASGNGRYPVAGHGLRNLHDRARELGAHLEIDSQLGAGTRVSLRCPLRARPRMTMRTARRSAPDRDVGDRVRVNASDARAEPDRAPRAMPRAIMSTRVRVRVHE